ncbi:MAG TPA: tyrosine-type recombinase/integrase [Ktedonobacteraceae bacterium]
MDDATPPDSAITLLPVTVAGSAIMTALGQAGVMANARNARNAFAAYEQTLDENTLARQRDDLAHFSLYLAEEEEVFLSVETLMASPLSWVGMTHGLVEEFRQWMLDDGYSIGTINLRLSTVRQRAKLAAKAGALSTAEQALIAQVHGITYAEGVNIDAKRAQTRRGAKKAQPVVISAEQREQLKQQPDTPQGRRDALLMCLLLDHGLRCGEVADLPPQAVRLSERLLVFYREKRKNTQRHKLTADTLLAAVRYFEDCTPTERLLVGSRKGLDGLYVGGSMGRRAITKRVCALGKRIGLVGLSAHDCRHAWVDAAIRGKTDLKALQDAGGWNSLAMPLRYAHEAEIANEGVVLA